MRSKAIVTNFVRISKWIGKQLDRLPYGAGAALRKTRIARAINFRIARKANEELTGSAPLCVLPWSHVQIETTGEVQLCCLAHHPNGSLGNVQRESIVRIFESDRMNAIREQMLHGAWPPDCYGCRDREALGLISFRQSKNIKAPALFKQLASGSRPAPRIRSLDLRLNNVCNFKCRFCNGFASNRWFNEHNLAFGDLPIAEKYHGFDRSQPFWDDFDGQILHNLDTLHLAGGEPLIIDAHYRLLEKLIAAGKTSVALEYNTNLSHLRFKHWDAVELWRKFPDIILTLSLDGVGRKGEYIRDGLDYRKWVENVGRLQREVPHARRALHFVVCIFNVIDFAEHCKTIAENRFVEPDWVTLTFLDWPAYLSVQVLMPELKAKAERNLREFLSSGFELDPGMRSQIEALIGFLKAKDLYDAYGKEFAERTRALDRVRGQNAAELFPDLMPMLETPTAQLVVVGP